jgi:hypothetical protein
MKEDILEQLVDSYFLKQQGSFTKHNLKYKPDATKYKPEDTKKYSVHSDIDIISYNPIKKQTTVVSCKSWQNGFNVKTYLNYLEKDKMKIISGRSVWKSFRELTDELWAEAFLQKIQDETGSKNFKYIIAVTKLINKDFKADFCNSPTFLNILTEKGKNKVTIDFLTIEEIIDSFQLSASSHTVESSEIGRILQLLNAAGYSL